jgi:hypothetical protein
MNTIQFQNEASGFTRRHLLGLDGPWNARLDFKNEQMRKQSTAVDPPCPFDEAQNGDYRPPSSTAKLSSSTGGCSHNFDAGHQSSYKTSRAEALKHHAEEKGRDYPRQPYRVIKFIQGSSTSNSSTKSIQPRSRAENSYRGSNLKNSHFGTFEMPYDFSTTDLITKLQGRSFQGIPCRSDLPRVMDFGETKQSSSAEEDAKSESSDDSEYVELGPRRNHHSKEADKRMPLLRQRVDDLRRRLSCISSLVNEMKNKLECEGDMDYHTYKKARSATVVKFAAGTKMPAADLAGWSPVQEVKSAEKKKEKFEAQLHKGVSDKYLNQRSPTSAGPVSSDQSPFRYSFAIAFNDWVECWNDLACTGWQQQEQSALEVCWGGEQKKSAGGKESSPPTPPEIPPTSASSATATETKQKSNSCWTHAWGFPKDTASLTEDSQRSLDVYDSVPTSTNARIGSSPTMHPFENGVSKAHRQ